MDYQEFLQNKRHSNMDYGIEPNYLNPKMFGFQKHVAEYAIKKGRCAVFLDTGLGKTLIQLVIAKNYVKHTNKPVLIVTPLAVAFQFIKEAEDFDIDKVEYSKDGRHTSKIVICNYERLKNFSADDFDCVLLDESSILKNFDGATKHDVTNFLKRVKYRYLFTATPSPNDFVELGTSSEALGYMGYMDMLTKFFTNNEDTVKPQNIGTKWLLKGHAINSFFDWVNSWSISMRKPSDLGFSDDGYDLPPLNLIHHAVENKENLVIDGQIQLFAKPSTRLTEVREEQKATINERCELAYELASKRDCSVYWCNFNAEAELISQLDKDAKEVKGSMDLNKKEDILLDFAKGNIAKIITKPKITAFGLNWQHCNHTTYFPTFSYEQYYQSIRRFWRFGQKSQVDVDLIYSDGQARVVDSLIAKAQKADELFTKLNNSSGQFKDNKKDFNKNVELPSFI